jgi:hypothetical protein
MTDVTITLAEYNVLLKFCDFAHPFVDGSEADAYVLLKRNKAVAAKIAALPPDSAVRIGTGGNYLRTTAADACRLLTDNLTAYLWLWFEDSKTLCLHNKTEE